MSFPITRSVRAADAILLGPHGHYIREDVQECLLDEDEDEDKDVSLPKYHKFMSDLDTVLRLLVKWTVDDQIKTALRGDWMEGVLLQTMKRRMKVIIDCWAVTVGQLPLRERKQLELLHDTIMD
jgi:hypothetical protein